MSWISGENDMEADELGELGHITDDEVSVVTYESDTDKKGKKKKGIKSSRLQNSPYLSSAKLFTNKAPVWRSLKGTGQMHTENPMAKVPRQLWLASLKQGNSVTQPVKSNTDTGQAWASPTSSTPEYLKEALGMKKPKYSRSSSNGYIPGTPDYKEKEHMYDQIIDLKKTLQNQKSECDIMKTKLRRLEEENSRKDRQIEQLLDPSRSSEYTRSLVDKKNDSSMLVNNLKQKILKLEKQCKEKDNALSKLQTDLKTTSLEEMKMAMETYYEEIQRLQLLLAKFETKEKRSPPESKESQKTQKVLNSAVVRLSKRVKELQEENHSLKTDLDRALSKSPMSAKSKGYSDWSKQRLVRRISELEKKLEKQSPSSAEEGSGDLKSQKEGDLIQPKPDLKEECERLKKLITKVKEDRGALQVLLETKESETKKLKQEKTELEKQLQKASDRNAEREEMQRLKQKIKKLEAALEDEKHEKEATLKAVKKHEFLGSRPSSARSTRSVMSDSQSIITPTERQRKQEAAQLIQKNWKLYKSKKEIDNSEEVKGFSGDQMVTLLQAALRGHLARQKYLSTGSLPRSKSPKAESLTDQDTTDTLDNYKNEDEAVSFLQAAFRAHLARSKMLGQRSIEPRGRDSPRSSFQKDNRRSLFSYKSFETNTPSGSIGDLREDYIEELSSEEEKEEAAQKRESIKYSPQRPPSVSSKIQQPIEEIHSDDSDDIIIVSPSRPPRRKDSNF
ncbi:IQ domain-containing protein E [Pelobates fuscus]|uniref:IQ domain-containing protein E n=1 Tax=Pelobates fuscus TaxID=191477 RepID=UPI002FE434FF